MVRQTVHKRFVNKARRFKTQALFPTYHTPSAIGNYRCLGSPFLEPKAPLLCKYDDEVIEVEVQAMLRKPLKCPDMVEAEESNETCRKPN